MSPSSYLPSRVGTTVTSTGWPPRSIVERHLALGLRRRIAIENSSQVSTGCAVDGRRCDRRAGCPAFAATESSANDADDDRLLLERRHLRALVEHDRHHDDRQHEVHHRAHDEDLEALPFRLRQELVGRAGARVFRVLAGHLHVAAERDGADAVLGVAAAERRASFGPKPSENVSTRTPMRRAIRKCPSSCTKISTPRTNTKAKNAWSQ